MNTTPEELEDPDNPVEDRGFVGRFTITAHVDMSSGTVTPSYGEDDQRIIDQCRKYADKAGGYRHSLWFLESEGISVVREDGAPFRQSDIIKLRSADGDKLGSNQTHAKLAEAFRATGTSASYAKVGEPDSAVGRTFQFAQREIKLGKSFGKQVKLFPVAIFDTDYVYDGEVRRVKAKAEDGAPTDGGASTAPAESEVIAMLQETLTGKTPGQMMQAVIDDTRLQSVPSVFGVPLLESATDETLVKVLQENRCMALAADGTLQPIA